MTPEEVLGSTAARSGHFVLESGHHSDYWLDLDLELLLVLGDSAARFTAENGLRLISLARRPHSIWDPGECPLCAAGVPLIEPHGA
jgi:hypothetical protein